MVAHYGQPTKASTPGLIFRNDSSDFSRLSFCMWHINVLGIETHTWSAMLRGCLCFADRQVLAVKPSELLHRTRNLQAN